MALGDLWLLVLATLRARALRTALSVLGIAIGVAAVVLLSSIGEGARAGIAAQFTQFGTTIVGVNPGRRETFGISPGAVGGTTRPLTLGDAEAIERIPAVRYVAPHIMGLGEVEAPERSRRTYVYGTAWQDEHVLSWHPQLGSFLPRTDPEHAPPVCVLGATVARDLFPGASPLGARVRIAERRFTVIGVMSPKGQVLGFDLDDMVYVPVRRAMRMLNRDEVSEIHVLVSSADRIPSVVAAIRPLLRRRHGGEEDFTLTSQADALELVGRVMDVVTRGVLVIAGVSLLVGAMSILTILWVSVHERTAEIGLAKAIGASDRQILLLFLAEAAALALTGALAGVALGLALGTAITLVYPALWIATPWAIVPVALAASLVTGLSSGVVPALRAARLDPVEALRAE